MYCYGWGDGGGGVDTEMLEYVKRYKKRKNCKYILTKKIIFDKMRISFKFEEVII